MKVRLPVPVLSLLRICTMACASLALLWGFQARAQDAEETEPQAEQEPIRIAMLPIVVHSADDPIFLREGLADMLTSRLDQVGGFEIVHVEDVHLATTRLEDALPAGREAGAEFVLFGSFTRFGTGASLDMQCASTSPGSGKRPLREIFVHSGSIGEVIPDLDDLVGKVSRFAITGYSESTEVAPTDNDGSGDLGTSDELGQELEDLHLRIESLEASLEELSGVVYDDQGAPGNDTGDADYVAESEDAEVAEEAGAEVAEEVEEGGPLDAGSGEDPFLDEDEIVGADEVSE
jgi:TolB-like protein